MTQFGTIIHLSQCLVIGAYFKDADYTPARVVPLLFRSRLEWCVVIGVKYGTIKVLHNRSGIDHNLS